MTTASISIKRITPIAVLLGLALTIFSCKVAFVTDYDQKIVDQVEKTNRMVDEFYLNMLEKTIQGDTTREYKHHVDNYVKIEVEIKSLIRMNASKTLNEHSTDNAKIALELWQKYKKKHKADNAIKNADIKLNHKYMEDVFFTILKAEEAKKSPPSEDTDSNTE